MDEGHLNGNKIAYFAIFKMQIKFPTEAHSLQLTLRIVINRD